MVPLRCLRNWSENRFTRLPAAALAFNFPGMDISRLSLCSVDQYGTTPSNPRPFQQDWKYGQIFALGAELASREQQLRLFESGGLLHVEGLPVAGTSLANLDRERIDYYLRSIIKDPEIPNTDTEWIERLLEKKSERRAEMIRCLDQMLTTEPAQGELLAPIEADQEVWAGGVAYLPSREARQTESAVGEATLTNEVAS
jgi:hypothetical protein